MSATTPPIIPSGKGSSFLRRKVAGVPVLYLFGAGAVVLAFYAWKSKGKSAAVTTAGDAAGTPATTSPTPQGSVYSGFVTGDTQYASTGQATSAAPSTPAITSNSDWVQKGVAYVSSQDPTASPGDVETGLNLYLQGSQLSIKQGQWRDMVIREYGLPPASAGTSTVVAAAPTPPASYVEFVRLAGSTNTTIWGVRSDNTREALTAAQYAALGRPAFRDAPATDPVWTYHTVGAYSDPIIPA